MTTQHTHDEQRDADVSVAEQLHASESGADSPSLEPTQVLDAATSITVDTPTPSIASDLGETDTSASLPTPAITSHEEQTNETETSSTSVDEALHTTTQEVPSSEYHADDASLVSVPSASEATAEGTTVDEATATAAETAAPLSDTPIASTTAAEQPSHEATTTDTLPVEQHVEQLPLDAQDTAVAAPAAITSDQGDAEALEAVTDTEAQANTPTAELEMASGFAQPEEAQSATPASETQEPEAVLPFTAFIEEFRQTEAQRGVNTLPIFGSEPTNEPFALLEAVTSFTYGFEDTPLEAAEPQGSTMLETGTHDAPADQEVVAEVTTGEEKQENVADTSTQERAAHDNTEIVESPTAISTPAVRPVSPLLRPATRLRVPRHGLIRSREHNEEHTPPATDAQTGSGNDTLAAEQQNTPATAEPQRPARRYRFDRPASASSHAAAGASPAATTQTPQARTEEAKPQTAASASPTPTPARAENTAPASQGEATVQPKAVATNGHNSNGAQPAPKPASAQPVAQESQTPPASNGISAISDQDRRRRHGQDRPREKDQPAQQAQTPVAPAANAPVTPPTVPPVQETPTPVAEQIPAMMIEDIAPEDLPPLEYAELQKATSRRRRRHRTGTNNATAAPTVATPVVAKVDVAPIPAPLIPPALPAAQVAAPQLPATGAGAGSKAAPPPTSAAAAQYTIVSGYTVNQMNQGNDLGGPFMAPEPSPARGSVLSRDGRTINRAESQRMPVYPSRTAEPSANSIQQLASVLSQAIQTQTDRMVAELHRANQAPTNVSVSFPPFPSTERVGVFVDVANLLYSARTLRIAVDFGKLLNFLRGNRRLVRAHAYCPTSPQAGDEQMFLQAVKGLGYRITTKNYKTFASGAKKADLDLDLCMDVVRLVDGRAVDCVVLVSGDSDFMPMLDYCSDHGVRVEVAAFDEAMSATLRQSCDLFVNLSMLEEIRS